MLPCHHQTALHAKPAPFLLCAVLIPAMGVQSTCREKVRDKSFAFGDFLKIYLCGFAIGFPTRMFGMISLCYSRNIKALLNMQFFYSPYEYIISHKCFPCKCSEGYLVFLKVTKNTPQPEKYGCQVVLKDLSNVFIKWPAYLHCICTEKYSLLVLTFYIFICINQMNCIIGLAEW